MTLEELKKAVQLEKVSTLDVAFWLNKNFENDDGRSFAQIISNDRFIKCDLDVVVQWSCLFIQAWAKDQTLMQTLKTYKYPNISEDLTEDVTKKWLVDRTKMTMTYIDDEYSSEKCQLDLLWHVVEKDNTFLFNTRYVVMPSNQVLRFD